MRVRGGSRLAPAPIHWRAAGLFSGRTPMTVRQPHWVTPAACQPICDAVLQRLQPHPVSLDSRRACAGVPQRYVSMSWHRDVPLSR
jgi:hypothetical protein